jgi:hypothetical protein
MGMFRPNANVFIWKSLLLGEIQYFFDAVIEQEFRRKIRPFTVRTVWVQG